VTQSGHGPSTDDWEAHWSEYSDAAAYNPAQEYRRRLVLDLVARSGTPHRLLDIGSGLGDLLATLRTRWPNAELAGIELTAEGIRQAGAKVPDARFFQLDLTTEANDAPELRGWADLAVCSEVLEHVDDPARFLQSAMQYVAPGGTVVVTVPGGPRTAFDRHIGHRRHYTTDALRTVLDATGLEVELVQGAGLPFFNLYKLLVMMRGDAVARDVSSLEPPSRLATVVMRAFGFVLRPRCNISRRGWQIVAVARRPVTES
jgi:SAM-dependent methyltransferase